MHLVVGLVLLAQVQVLVPIERPETAVYQIRQLCPVASPRDRDRLARLERRLSDSASAKQVPPHIWDALGCVRALQALNATLDRDDQIQAPIISIPQAEAAISTLFKALDVRPDDAQAAELLAALSQQATDDPIGARPMLLDDLAEAIHRAVEAGVASPSVLRACTRLQIAVGDMATAQECSNRATTLGRDSTWHLLRLARVRLSDGDVPGGIALFKLAALAAHDSASINELLYPFFAEANWAAWVMLSDSTREAWLRDSLLPEHIRGNEWYEARLALQLKGDQQGGGRSFYWWCVPQISADCAEPSPKGETVIRTTARFDQLWDLKTGAPVAAVTFSALVGDLASEKEQASRVASFKIMIRTWEEATRRWHDTTVERQLRFPASTPANAYATGQVTIPAPLGVTSWSIRIFQSADRRGRAADDRHTPIGEGSMRLSDLLVGSNSRYSTGEDDGPAFVLAPLGQVSRSKLLQFYLQAQSDEDHPRLKLFVAIRHMIGDSVEKTPDLELAFEGASLRGVNQYFHSFPISQLSPGNYQLQVMLLNETGNAILGKRATTLVVQ